MRGERLFADHVLAVFEKYARVRGVQLVGARDVHGVDRAALGHFRHIGENRIDAVLRAEFEALFARARVDGRELPEPAVERALNVAVCNPACADCTKTQHSLAPFRSFHDLDDGFQDFHDLFHVLEHDELVLAVGVFAAGAQVRAGQAHEGEPRAVGAAADRDDLRLHAVSQHGGLRRLDDLHVRQNLFLHVVVHVRELHGDERAAVLAVQKLCGKAEIFLAVFEKRLVVVADDVVERRVLDLALHADEMRKALVALGVFRHLVLRQEGGELHRDGHRVNHLVFGAAGVDAEALDRDVRRGAVEVLVFELAEVAAVHGVGEVAAEALDIEFHGPLADLLVRRERDFHGAMRQIALENLLRHLQDLRDAGLVVAAEQRRAVGDNQRFAPAVLNRREIGNARDDAECLVQHDVAAVVLLDDARLHVLAAEIRRGVHVRDKADGVLFLAVCRDCAVHVAVRVHESILDADALHFLDEVRPEGFLLLSGGDRIGRGIGLRVIADVI